jgi:hypothetical protein
VVQVPQFLLCARKKTQAGEIAATMHNIYQEQKIEAHSFVAGINNEGTILK